MSVDFKNLTCIGILGGTFNPVHNGHLMMAKHTHEQIAEVEKVVFMPNNLPAYKDSSSIVSNQHRINMLKLAVLDMPYADVSDLEIKRGGVTYSIDTLNEIKMINPNIKIYFIIGADSLFTFDKWYRFEEIFALCTLLVAIRDTNMAEMEKRANAYRRDYGAEVFFLRCDEVRASSTKIRELCKNGISVNDMLPANVADYILENGLYV